MDDRSFSNGAGPASSATLAASKYGLTQEVQAAQVTSFGMV
jgi:hypothetical protein